MYNSIVLRLFTERCSHRHDLALGHFYHPEKKPHAYSPSVSMATLPQPLETTNPCPVSTDLPFLEIS